MQNTQFDSRGYDNSADNSPRAPLERKPRRLARLLDGPAAWLVTFLVIPALLAAILLLPPVSLLDRLETFTYTRIGAAGGVVRDSDGTLVNFPSEGLAAGLFATLESTPRETFMNPQPGSSLYDAANALPSTLTARSPFYDLKVRGSEPSLVDLRVQIPNLPAEESGPAYETLALYQWTGSEWLHVPATVRAEEDIIEAEVTGSPDAFLVVQTTPGAPQVMASMAFDATLPEGVQVTSESKPGLMLRGDGALEASNGFAPPNTGSTMPIVRNWEADSNGDPANVRTDLLNNMLADPGQIDVQVDAIEQTVVQNDYAGIVIDYRGVDAVPTARADFVYFVSRVADRLHAGNKQLALRVEAPAQESVDSWNTKAYDWSALGKVVDTLIVPAPRDPRAYRPDGEMASLLRFSTSQVENDKLQFELSGYSMESSGNYLLPKGYQEALRPLLNDISLDNDDGEVTLTLDNPQLLSQVDWSDEIGMYIYSYLDDQGLERTVYIESAGSLNHKLAMMQNYNVRSVKLDVPLSGDVDPEVWALLREYQEGNLLSNAYGQLQVAYTVYDENDELVTQEVLPLDSPSMTFSAPEGDDVRVEAQLVNSQETAISAAKTTQLALSGSSARTSRRSVARTGDSTEADVSDDLLAATEDALETARAGDGQVAAASTGDARVNVAQVVNVRGGPGTNYNTLGQITPGNNYPITGINGRGDWVQIDYGNGQNGWVINQLVTAAGNINDVAVITDVPAPPQPLAAAPAPAAAPAEEAPAGEAPTEETPAEGAPEEAPPEEAPATEAPVAAPVVSAPPPTGGGSFGYGIQAHMVHNNMENQVMTSIQGMGFNWVKQQIEWKVFEGSPGAIDFGSSDGIINAANASGINVLFSIVNAPAWAREDGFDGSVGGPPVDPQTYANFVGAVASKYCGTSLKAIEVWNEQNLHYEWGNMPLDPAAYMNLLRPAYASIKAACPEMQVISGALTPTGNNGGVAIDDFQYLEGMFNNGLAQYADGIGAHPSGYNVPASVTWEGACEAIQVSGNNFNGPCNNPHHSWSFRSTMEGYRNLANIYGAGNLLIWPTEFGWAAGGAFDDRYAYANDNDYNEQAEWTVEAYQMMKSWGWVGPAFLWNLNFRVVANGTEKAQWGIVDPGWGPLPAYNALAAMPK